MRSLDSKMLFVGLGAQKTGTTWMADYLDSHPQVYVSPVKELHYFSAKYLGKYFDNIFIKKIKRLSRSLEGPEEREKLEKLSLYLERLAMRSNGDYLKYFSRRVPEEVRVFGEITPAYSMLHAPQFAEMYRLHGEVRFIFGMRSPVERYWSHLRYARGFRKDFDPIGSFEKKLEDPQFILRTDYIRTIRELEAKIPKEKIFYYFYEDLFGAKGEEVVRDLCKFLGVDYRKPDFGKSVNVSGKIDLDDEKKALALERFRHVIDGVEERFGYVPANWRDL